MATEKGNTDFLTVPKAAREIGVHFATIYRWIEAGSIASLRFGGILFIPATEIERIKSNEQLNKGKTASV